MHLIYLCFKPEPKNGIKCSDKQKIPDGQEICGSSPDLNSGLDGPTFVFYCSIIGNDGIEYFCHTLVTD